MEITIKAEPKEIADLVSAIQNRQEFTVDVIADKVSEKIVGDISTVHMRW